MRLARPQGQRITEPGFELSSVTTMLCSFLLKEVKGRSWCGVDSPCRIPKVWAPASSSSLAELVSCACCYQYQNLVSSIVFSYSSEGQESELGLMVLKSRSQQGWLPSQSSNRESVLASSGVWWLPDFLGLRPPSCSLCFSLSHCLLFGHWTFFCLPLMRALDVVFMTNQRIK